MNDIALKYRAEILRAVLGGNPHPAGRTGPATMGR